MGSQETGTHRRAAGVQHAMRLKVLAERAHAQHWVLASTGARDWHRASCGVPHASHAAMQRTAWQTQCSARA
ncbi:hypothetical protein XhhCFBP4925_14575 [Xanthomonas hortorum pv. hederae]|nr:hypothetical protein XhhCFBP4925_14575 [Xanthomonas hortorum pv. hederae]